MKKFLLVLILAVFVLPVFAQTYELTWGSHNDPINSGDTISVDSLSNVNEMVVHISVKNITNHTISVFCEKQYVDIVAGTTNTFCWAGACWPSTTMISPNPLAIAAGATTTEFSGHYEPKGNEGTSIIRYVFKITGGDSVMVYVKYIALPVGIAENRYTSIISAPYPNPAKSIAYINYNVRVNTKAYLQVYNICGKLEKQFYLTDNNGVLKLNVSDLPSGMYFCTLNVDGKIATTNKLIVSH